MFIIVRVCETFGCANINIVQSSTSLKLKKLEKLSVLFRIQAKTSLYMCGASYQEDRKFKSSRTITQQQCHSCKKLKESGVPQNRSVSSCYNKDFLFLLLGTLSAAGIHALKTQLKMRLRISQWVKSVNVCVCFFLQSTRSTLASVSQSCWHTWPTPSSCLCLRSSHVPWPLAFSFIVHVQPNWDNNPARGGPARNTRPAQGQQKSKT